MSINKADNEGGLSTAPPISTKKSTSKKRFLVLAMVFITVVVNYMDRSNLSVAAAALSDELKLSPVQMGLIFSAFGWTYSVMQIPGGMLVDKIRSRVLYPIILVAWSAATLLQGIANSALLLIGCRMGIGVFEAPSYPINNKVATNWFPENERASAISVYTSGQFLGIAFLMPVLTAIQVEFGWRGLFVISGIIGIVWAVIWYMFYRDPDEHPTVSESELKHISDGGGYQQKNASSEPEITKKFSWADLWADVSQTFRHRKLWGIYIGQFCLGGVMMFFMTWFPNYLTTYRGFDFKDTGYLASIPFIAAFIGILLSGFTSDFLVRAGVSKEIARKAPIILGMLLSTTIVGANYTDNTVWMMTFLSISFFGIGLASITWVFVSLLAPKEIVGAVGGTFNFIGGTSSIIVPIVIGILAQGGRFEPALIFVSSLGVVGACSYLFLVGKVERIEL